MFIKLLVVVLASTIVLLAVGTGTPKAVPAAAVRSMQHGTASPRYQGSAGMIHPASYRLTLIRESSPGKIHAPGLRIYPPYPLFSGLTRLEVTVRWKDGQWRESDHWLAAPPPHTSTLAPLNTAPLPNATASDGHRMWLEDPSARTVTVYPPDPAGTWPATEGTLKQFTVGPTLPDLLQNNFHCLSPIRHTDSHIAGRPVYVLEFGQDECQLPPSQPSQSRLLDGRVKFWIDKETHFALREDQYEFGRPNQLILRWYVTAIRYNVKFDPALFRLTIPSGYRLVHGAVGRSADFFSAACCSYPWRAALCRECRQRPTHSRAVRTWRKLSPRRLGRVN